MSASYEQRSQAVVDGVEAIDPELTLKGLAILHAEVGGGEPLELGLR